MQNNGEHIDELFHNRLSGYEVTPPPNVWDNISASMALKRKKRKAMLLWGLSSAASVAIAFMLGWTLSDKPSDYEKQYAEIEKIKQEYTNSKPISSVVEQQIELKFEQTQPQLLQIDKEDRNQTVNKESTSGEANNISIPLLLAANINTVTTSKPQYNIIRTTSGLKGLTASDRTIIEANLLALNNTRQQKGNEKNYKQWAVGLKASPQVRFDELAMNDADYAPPQADFSASQNSISTNYASNISAGLSVAYNASKRLSFISGLNYNEMTQTAENIALAFAGHNWAVNSGESDFITGKTMRAERDRTNTTAIIGTDVGLANINMPAGVELAKASYLYSSSIPATEGYDYKQNAGYIEVPLLMKYQLNDNTIGLHLIGGINTNILVSNNVNLSQNENTIASGNIEGLRDISFSSSLGAGMSYNITKWLNFNIEPIIKIQLNSLSELQGYNVRPYTFGVYSGLQYMF
ncbi:MAG: outer membrane beta-barrel protein [Prolixibacteraceae bacterium]|jgi:hypothetical protein|nr:outer membrane beta-barrel protein [Prolixibacteraceae bacterium]